MDRDVFTESWTEDLDWTSPTDDAPPSELDDTHRVGSFLLQVIFAPAVFFGNILILVAIKKSRSFRKVTYLFIGNLAVADLLLGLAICARSVLIITYRMNRAYPCLVTNAMVVVSGGSSMTGILLLCLDSYLSVRYSVTLKAVFTFRMAWELVGISWVFWLTYGIMGIALADVDYHMTMCYLPSGIYSVSYLVALPLVYLAHLCTVLFFQVATIVLTHMRFRSLQRLTSITVAPVFHIQGNARTAANPTTTNNTPDQVRSTAQRRRLQRLSNMSKIVFLVLGIFFLCYFPSMVGLLLFLLCVDHCGLTEKDIVNMASLIVISSFVNVIVYGLKSPEFKASFRHLLCRKRCCRCRCGKNKVEPLSSDGPEV